MPYINLTIDNKDAIGDGTRIVCMNSDYTVRVYLSKLTGASAPVTFILSPVKKLIVRYGKEYREAKLEPVSDGFTTHFEVKLPPIERTDYVELGVCGKTTDDESVMPTYTSKSARYECEKSVLCGTAILKSDPKLGELEVTSNGQYEAANRGVDGFYKVNVNVGSKLSENRTVDLSMANGNQDILPSRNDRTMDMVTVKKPITLTPSNIKKGINIGGVVGTYGQKLVEQTVYTNGEYVPPAGADGFSKVIVDINEYNIEKKLVLGESFKYEYDKYVVVTTSPPGIVTWTDVNGVLTFEGNTIGSCKITVQDYNTSNAIVKTLNYIITVVATDGTATGTLDITENGNYFIADKEYVNVNVPIPDGYIDESIVITSLGEIDAVLGGV